MSKTNLLPLLVLSLSLLKPGDKNLTLVAEAIRSQDLGLSVSPPKGRIPGHENPIEVIKKLHHFQPGKSASKRPIPGFSPRKV